MAGAEFKRVDGVLDDGRAARTASGSGPCMSPDCRCCGTWMGIIGGVLTMAKRLAGIASDKAEDCSAKGHAVRALQETKSALAEDNRRLVRANKKLNAENNKIRTVPDKDRKSTGKVGRPRGQKPTRNRRPERTDREEVIDIRQCPDGHLLSDNIAEQYDRVVKVTHVMREIVKYVINRRWCRECGKLFHNDPPGVAPYARVSANHSAIATSLNMSGLSHGKVAGFCRDAMKGEESRSWSYRNKIGASRRLAPEHRRIRERTLREPYLQCDEMWWKIPGSNSSKIMVARGAKSCLAEVVWSANIEAAKKMLFGYAGVVGQDSNPIWLHVGRDHQMCMQHQRRLSKKDLTYRNLNGDPLLFLTELRRLDYLHHVYDKIGDPHTRTVAARCLEKSRSELLYREFVDDKDGTIARRRKRHAREGRYMTTHMYRNDVDPDNNGVERVNRRFTSIRGDGGGNRSQKGMNANSILFTVMATDWINKASFFDHLVRSSSGYG